MLNVRSLIGKASVYVKSGFLRVRKRSEIKFFKSHQKVSKKIIKMQVCMISQVKSKNDVCSQEMYGYGNFLVLITPFNHSKTAKFVN